MIRKDVLPLTALAFLLIAFLLLPEDSLAGAEGGGDNNGYGWIGALIQWVIYIILSIYGGVVTRLFIRKNKESRALLARLSERDPTWDLDKIKKGIEITFSIVQKAWMERDQSIAKDYMSERLYNSLKLQTDEMLTRHRKIVRKNVILQEAKIVEVADYKDDSKDRIWVHISGSMIDYSVDDRTGKVIKGNSSKAEDFSELWKFVRGPKGWLLDTIDQKVTASGLRAFRPFSEELE